MGSHPFGDGGLQYIDTPCTPLYVILTGNGWFNHARSKRVDLTEPFRGHLDDRDLFKPRKSGRLVSSLPNTVYPRPRPPLSTLRSPQHVLKIPMAYFYNNNTNFHSTPSTSGGFDRYPFLNQASTTGETNPQTLSAFADGWGFGGYPNYAVDSSRGLRAEQSLGKRSRSLLDGRHLTRVSRISDSGHPIRGPNSSPRGTIVPRVLLANNWPVCPVPSFRNFKSGQLLRQCSGVGSFYRGFRPQ